MNQHSQMLPQVPPTVQYPNGRTGHGHAMPYTPPPYPHQPQQYPAYPYRYPMQYQRPPPQWDHYQSQMGMSRGYLHYPTYNPYPAPQQYSQMRPAVYHHPSSSSFHSAPGVRSPSASDASSQFPSAPSSQALLSQQAPINTLSDHRTPTPVPVSRLPFYPPLPWQSFKGDFPARTPRRQRKGTPQSAETPVILPVRPNSSTVTFSKLQESNTAADHNEERVLSVSEMANIETPSTSHAPSEVPSSLPTTPSSSTANQQTTPKAIPSSRITHQQTSIQPAVPTSAVPLAPKMASGSAVSDTTKTTEPSNADFLANAAETASLAKASEGNVPVSEAAAVPVIRAAPKSWAELLRTKADAQSGATIRTGPEHIPATSTPFSSKSGSVAAALRSFSTKSDHESKIAFLEPKGLVNTGNMCYMNSVLQALVFCVPFYAFLEKIGRQAAYSFKSGTPMLDSMIMFMKEYNVIDAAVSVEQLRMRLKDNELEQYGDAFIPEFVYDVIRHSQRFSSMRRGHQQDAEEFLGFLLEELHEECSRVMKGSGDGLPTTASASHVTAMPGPPDSRQTDSSEENGWLEVGPKQRAAITRSSGSITTESPVTKIFGGKLRSELRIPGSKSSVTLEPYQPLQLDIGMPNINNISDALRGLTRSETLHGDFNSPRGPGSTATKQVTIETLPQVLILHLKRFQYDNAGGVQKIWKKIGYPLDLEIPKEVFAQHKRGGMLAHGGMPRYRLISVVYHHGKNASGGHYTVDVRRQDGREWIRLDDTVIRRIRSEEVAQCGSEEDPKILSAALAQHKEAASAGMRSANMYETVDSDAEEEGLRSKQAWNQVNGAAPSSQASGKKWSSIANGSLTPNVTESGKMTPVGKTNNLKDSKVAYILFYERVNLTPNV